MITDALHRACITQDAADEGGTVFAEPIRCFLRDLSAKSPACQIVPPCDLAAVQLWQAALCGALAAEDEAAALLACTTYMEQRSALAESAPVVEPCLTEVLRLATLKDASCDLVCGAIEKLVGSLLRVCVQS